MKEVWKQVDGYPNYEVSNTGKIKSLNYRNTGKEKLLKGTIDKCGYIRFVLSDGKKSKHISLHRAVATAFIPNPNNLDTVDHIDGNKSNNNVSNLQWLSAKDNIIKYYKEKGCHISYGKPRYGNRKRGELLRVPIKQYSLSGNLINSFNSLMDAERKTGINSGGISACINGKKHTAGGYKWIREQLISTPCGRNGE